MRVASRASYEKRASLEETALRTFGCGAFVAPPAQSSLRGAVPAAGAVAYGALVAAVPEPAMAVTEKELNNFGVFFAVFFLGFFLAGFARLFTVGKL